MYDQLLWTSIAEKASKTPVAADCFKLEDEIRSGDYLEDDRLIQALKNGVPPDFDVDDAADWSAITALSEMPVANRSHAIEFPDFTKGKWKSRLPIEITGD